MYKELTEFLIEHYSNKINSYSYRESWHGGPEEESEIMNREIDSINTTITYNKTKIRVVKSEEKYDNRTDCSITLTCWKKDKPILDKLINELEQSIINKRNKDNKIEVFTYSSDGWNQYRHYTPINIDQIYCSGSIKEEYLEDLNKFVNRKEWYERRNITYNRGYLLYGPPRNGKSALIAATARLLNRSVYYLNLNGLRSEDDLVNAFSEIPCGSILAIEDLDNTFKGRENVNPKCNITFATFINLLSGLLEKDDLITFITTNHFDSLDPALIGNRRINKKIEFILPNKNDVELYLSDMYGVGITLSQYNKSYSYGGLLDLFEDHENDCETLIKLIEE
jgi:DNA replication protein DnaC